MMNMNARYIVLWKPIISEWERKISEGCGGIQPANTHLANGGGSAG